ncbi:MAG: glycosyltransferase N-terminal domain-containing protein [Bacteroidota bacterium]
MLLYSFFIRLYGGIIWLAGLFNRKANKWVSGRVGQLPKIRQALDANRPLLWMHCASAGEFEQGRPLLEKLRDSHPQYQLLLSFFSPSGYELRKNYALAEHVCYIPLDTASRANAFVDAIRPRLVVMVKNEFWPHHLRAVQQRAIPIILISATFRKDQWLFKGYAKPFLRLLKGYQHIFVQDSQSLSLLKAQGIDACSVVGDTRIDRVLTIAAQQDERPLIAAFVGQQPVLVAGSTWPADEALLADLLAEFPKWKLIVAPHEIDEDHLKKLEQLFSSNSVRYSRMTESSTSRVLIVDNIGMLASLYRYGDLAYVGGGFGKGIHNLLEPTAHRMAVIFGPRNHKFREASLLIGCGGGFSIKDATSLKAIFRRLQSKEDRLQAGEKAYRLLAQNAGASEKIHRHLQNLLDQP